MSALFQKYRIPQQLLTDPQKREMVNQKFSFLLSSGQLLSKFTGDEVFGYYTGNGGLHGLKREDFYSYHDYSEAKKEFEMGAFFTPDHFFEKIHRMIGIEKNHFVADLSFGKGGFFNHCPNESNVYGCELDKLSAGIAQALFPKGQLYQGDLRLFSPDVKMDVVFGNPPFNLRWNYKNELHLTSQLVYVLKAAEVLKEGGLLVLLVPNSFLSDEFSDRSDMEKVDFHYKLLAQVKLDKQLFKSAGVDAYDTKLVFLQKDTAKSEDIDPKDKVAKLINIGERKERGNDFSQFVEVADDILFYESVIKPVLTNLKSASLKLLNNSATAKHGFEYKVKKYLYDLKRSPNTNEYHPKCLAYYNKFLTQKCPEDMDYDVWVKNHKISEKMVLTYLKRYLQKHNPQRVYKKGDIVKTDHMIVRYKTASQKEYTKINDVVWYDQMHHPDIQGYKKLMRKKRKAFEIQAQYFDEMKLDPGIQKFLKGLTLYNDQMEPIYLNTIQLSDTDKVLQKRYSYLQWEQGTGKTVTGLAQIKYRLHKKQVDKVFVAGPAIAVDGTWDDALERNGFSYINVKSLDDLLKAMKDDNDVVLISQYYLNKYRRQLKRLVKYTKIFLILDEADEASNPSAKRTKSMLDIFRRVEYKTLMSGTSVRNNIVEFYPQLELLYNNSILMMDECREYYKINTNTKIAEAGTVLSEGNRNWGNPFPAYRIRNFKSAFNPSKVTVFGIKKQDQEVFNHEELAHILDYTVITRTFEEVVGHKKHKIHQDLIESNHQEEALHEKIKKDISEFYGLHIHKTGNDRKDAMLKLLHKMQLLFKSCAQPKSFREYTLDTFSKYDRVKEYLDKNDGHVAVGGIHREEMQGYAYMLQRDYPEREIFYIDGEMSIKKRKEIVKLMRDIPGSILVSTEGALKSSLNIPYIDEVLIVSLPWNYAQLSQYFARFVRFDSKNFKHIRFITLSGTIESNLLKLLVDKESLVSFMKTKKLKASNKLEISLEMLLALVVNKEELKEEKDKKAA